MTKLLAPFKGTWISLQKSYQETLEAGYSKRTAKVVYAVEIPFVILGFFGAPFLYTITCLEERKLLTAEEYAENLHKKSRRD